jgi:hypothetical protein
VYGRDPAFPIDEESGGQSIHTAVKLGCLIVANHHAVVHLEALDERLDDVPTVIVHRNTEHYEAFVLVLALEIDEPGDFDFAGTAPGGPKIEENHFAAVIGEMNDFAVRIFQGKVRSKVPVLV